MTTERPSLEVCRARFSLCYKCVGDEGKMRILFRQDTGPLTRLSYWACAEHNQIVIDPELHALGMELHKAMQERGDKALLDLGFDERDLAD